MKKIIKILGIGTVMVLIAVALIPACNASPLDPDHQYPGQIMIEEESGIIQHPDGSVTSSCRVRVITTTFYASGLIPQAWLNHIKPKFSYYFFIKILLEIFPIIFLYSSMSIFSYKINIMSGE